MTTDTPGFDPSRLARLRAALNDDVKSERCDGVSMALLRRGQVVFSHQSGHADRAAGRSIADDDVYVAFSITKQFVHVLALDRVERGQLSLSTRVADVIPEFGCRGKEHITLAHLLTHTSGLPLKLPPMPDPMQMIDLEALVAATCACMPDFVPGERVSYSGIVGAAVIAQMLRRVEGSGRRLRDLMNEDLFVPLGMKDTSLGLRADLAPRLVPVVARDRRPGVSLAEEYEMFGAMITPDAEMPGLGALSTRADLLRFTRMLAEGGVLDGKRILSPAMIDLATRNHTGDKPNEMLSYTVASRGWAPFPATLGLGFFVRGDGLHPHPFGSLASPRTFGGLGAGSSMFWVDPARELGCVFLSAGIITDESRNIDRLQRLSDLALAAPVD